MSISSSTQMRTRASILEKLDELRLHREHLALILNLEERDESTGSQDQPTTTKYSEQHENGTQTSSNQLRKNLRLIEQMEEQIVARLASIQHSPAAPFGQHESATPERQPLIARHSDQHNYAAIHSHQSDTGDIPGSSLFILLAEVSIASSAFFLLNIAFPERFKMDKFANLERWYAKPWDELYAKQSLWSQRFAQCNLAIAILTLTIGITRAITEHLGYLPSSVDFLYNTMLGFLWVYSSMTAMRELLEVSGHDQLSSAITTVTTAWFYLAFIAAMFYWLRMVIEICKPKFHGNDKSPRRYENAGRLAIESGATVLRTGLSRVEYTHRRRAIENEVREARNRQEAIQRVRDMGGAFMPAKQMSLSQR